MMAPSTSLPKNGEEKEEEEEEEKEESWNYSLSFMYVWRENSSGENRRQL